jgi:ferric-dicitrate binding protein FerR (iron transport regulator)
VPLAEGASVRVFQDLQARGEALIELAGGGNLRVARATEIEIVASDAVRLRRGEIYVDIPPGANDGRFRVVTRAGEFRHVGTQFSVAVANDQTRLRVREGAVAWHAPQGESTIEAGTEMTIGSGGVDRRPISISGRDWAWAESLAPDFDIQDRPLREFLEWFSRETGRELVIVDEVARSQVGGIHMHGNVQGLTALEALAAVMASTTLHYELPEGVIRVSSPRDPRPPR